MASKEKEICCPKHPLTVMVCPRCIAAKGGKATARKYGSDQLARWGRRGGRPKKKKKAPRKLKLAARYAPGKPPRRS